MDLYLIGQILGFVVAIYGFCIYIVKKRSHILIAKLISDVLNVIQQVLIGAYTGAVINFVTVFREIVFYNRGKKKWATHVFWLILFIAAMAVTSVFTWIGPVSLLPTVGSMFATVGFYCKKPRHTRIFGICSHILWFIYGIAVHNYGSMLGNAILTISAVTGLIRDMIAKRKNAVADDKDSITE